MVALVADGALGGVGSGGSRSGSGCSGSGSGSALGRDVCVLGGEAMNAVGPQTRKPSSIQ